MASSRGPGRPKARVRGSRTSRSANATALDDLGAILDHLDEVLYVVRFPERDPFGGTVQFVGGRAQAITGCGPREFVEDPGLWASLLHPDDLPALHAATQAILETRRPAVRDYRLRNRATSEYRQIEDRVAPLLDAGGNVIGIVGAARDVTQRLLADEALRASEARVQTLVDSMEDIVFVLDRDQRHVAIFGRWLERYGLSPNDFLGRTAREILGADAAPVHEQANGRALSGESVVYDWSLEEATGVRYFQTSVAPVRDAGGQVIQIVGIGREITEAKRAAQAVEQGQRRLQAIFENSLDAILLFDDQARLVDANPAALLRLGYTPVAREALTAWDLVPPEQRQGAEQLWRRLLTEGSLNGEHVVRRKDGSVREVEYRAVANILPGLNLAVARDVTERRLAERALEARARQQAVVAGLGQRALAESGLPGFFDLAVRAMAETLQLDFCGVFERLPESGALLLRAGVGWAEGLVGHAAVVPVAGSHAQYVLDSGEPVVVEDLACEARFTPESLLIEHGAQSGACVAIHGPEAPLGALCAYTRARRVFAPDEIDFLRSVANVLGAAIVHARDEHDRRRLLERVISVQDDERRRVARELHDETSQSLTSLLIGLRTIQAAPSLKTARERAQTLRPILAQTLEELGRLARGLHPSALDDLGLLPALEHFCQDHQGLRGLDVRVEVADTKLRLPAEVELMLYRVAQEALTNVVRHARARRVRVGLAQRDGAVELRVEDDGIGFDTRAALQAAASARRLGLIGIRERVALLGGSFSLTSESGKGTVLVVRCSVAGA